MVPGKAIASKRARQGSLLHGDIGVLGPGVREYQGPMVINPRKDARQAEEWGFTPGIWGALAVVLQREDEYPVSKLGSCPWQALLGTHSGRAGGLERKDKIKDRS